MSSKKVPNSQFADKLHKWVTYSVIDSPGRRFLLWNLNLCIICEDLGLKYLCSASVRVPRSLSPGFLDATRLFKTLWVGTPIVDRNTDSHCFPSILFALKKCSSRSTYNSQSHTIASLLDLCGTLQHDRIPLTSSSPKTCYIWHFNGVQFSIIIATEHQEREWL